MLLISGEPGIGKTRLVRELVTQVQVSGGRALMGACYAEGGVPYAPFVQILRQALGGDAEADLELPEFVLADLLTLAPALRLRYPDISSPNPPLDDPQAEQHRLFENLAIFCRAERAARRCCWSWKTSTGPTAAPCPCCATWPATPASSG